MSGNGRTVVDMEADIRGHARRIDLAYREPYRRLCPAIAKRLRGYRWEDA
jgi:hypothetical protein